jgi:type II secretory pathway component PulK
MKLAPSKSIFGTKRASIFVLVLWISFGLVVLSLYFANSMSFELKSADNRVASTEANMAINGAARYASYIVSTFATNGVIPDRQYYRSEWVPVGEANFWFLGEPYIEQQRSEYIPAFGLVDEASKLNLNTAAIEMLQMLPGMTVEFAAAIVDWRDTNAEASENGAENEMYQRLSPARSCKNAPFESVDELRLVYGATIEMLDGEDSNRNGILDPNENDGDLSLPLDNADGRLQPGIISYVTVHSRQLNTKADGSQRINVTANNSRTQLQQLFEERFGAERAGQISTTGPFTSVLQFYARSGMTADEFAQIEDELTASTQSVVQGLINVNTASEAVLACIPGIGEDKAPTLVAERNGLSTSQLSSIAWVKDALDTQSINQAGPFLTGRTYQLAADVVAVGRFNRGFRRTRFVIDATQSTPRIIFRQDLSHLGWALGQELRNNLQQELESRL